MPSEQDREIPDPEAFFVETGLYQRFDLNPERIRAIEEFRGTLDLFCVECKQISVFRRDLPPKAPNLDAGAGAGVRRRSRNEVDFIPPPIAKMQERREALRPRVFEVEFECSRNTSHKATFVFKVGKDSICKIGQFPSRADLQYLELKKYRKILGSQYTEFTKAIGLVAHGIGVGSFVYLRRIFERLVEGAAQDRLQREPNWDIDEWRASRMKEKIKDLAAYLPDFLVENSALYGILSKGIHELQEEECLKYFDVVRIGIEAILDEKLAEAERRKKRSLAQKSIARVKSALGKSSQ